MRPGDTSSSSAPRGSGRASSLAQAVLHQLKLYRFAGLALNVDRVELERAQPMKKALIVKIVARHVPLHPLLAKLTSDVLRCTKLT